MTEFNLIDEPWIPCIDRNGRCLEYGIRDTLLKAHELREICDDSPLVTVALHRLLLAILYRVPNAPRGSSAWSNLYAKEAFNADSVTRYLSKWRERFDLVSNSRPFFQMGELEMKKAVSVTRLATECASGNNGTLFDHCADDDDVSWPAAKIARQLIASQSFALGFGKSGTVWIGGKAVSPPYLADAIALRGMNIWLQGKNLFDTLMINLAPVGDSSVPAWEEDNAHKHRDKTRGNARMTVASEGVIDRLTWQSRLIRLLPNDEAFSKMYFTQGRSADKTVGDPMKVYRATEEEGVFALSLSSQKAAWRDAHSILTIPVARSDERRPECFNHVALLCSRGLIKRERQFRAHVVGLASAPRKAGKFLLWRHERMPVSAALLGDVNLIERLGELLESAEQAAIELRSRSWQIAKFYRVPSDRVPNRKEKEDINSLIEKIDPRPAYWARMEKHFFLLLEELPNDWGPVTNGWKPDDQQKATSAWRVQVKAEAQRSLEESVKSLGMTARAIQAVARVRTNFTDDDLKPHPLRVAEAKGKARGGKQR